MKKICFIELQPFPTTIGGGITHLNELSKELLRRGYDVSIITSSPGKNFKLDSGLEKLHIYHVGLVHKRLEDFKGIRKIIYYLWRGIFEITFVFSVARVLKKEKFDIINTQSAITTSLPCSLLKKDFFITAHGIHSEGFKKLYHEKKNFFVSNLASWIYQAIEKFNAKRARAIICLGKNSFDFYSNYNRCIEIPNGINTKRFSSNITNRKKIIVSVGRLTEQKAVDNLILAMDYLPDYKLKIIGLGPMEELIKQMCSKRKNCEFLGYKTQDEIVSHLKDARFTVLPSLFEGLPISMLEAMACGVIPIVTPVGDIPSIIQDKKNGFLLADNLPKTIHETIRIAEKKDLKELSHNCSKLIKDKFSWEKIANRFITTWETN